ncbi:MAG: peptide MFS transporter [Bacteroidales bacterium]|nr:peptide MFS transporter [Bacteroidales bacterium]
MNSIQMKQPRALIVLFFTEMWERFSYYGMRALLVLYLIQQLFQNLETSKTVAYGIFAAYGSLVYASPFIGGLIADKFLGHRKAVIWGAIMMAIGHFLMAIENEMFLYLALSFLIVGNGFFKPNMPIILSGLYEENDPRRDGGFTIYYMSVNLGAFFSPILCGIVGETYGWHYGFTIAGIGMLAGLFIFLKFGHIIDYHENINVETGEKTLEYRPLGGVPDKESLAQKFCGLSKEIWIYSLCVLSTFGIALLVKHYEIMSYVIFPLSLAILGFIFVIALRSSKVERDRLFVILILLLFITLFWTFFEQAGSSLTLYASENVNRNFFGSVIPASLFQSVNPMFILIFASPLSILWMQLAQRKKEPSTPIKFAMGILLLSIGFLLLGLAPRFLSFETIVENNTMLKIAAVPAIFLVLSYMFQTLGELCLSPIGLSMVSRLAPPKIVGMVIGAWYLSSSLAFQVGGWIANLTTDKSSYEIADNSENTETIDESTASYTAILASENSQQALQTAVNKNYLSEETLQTISDEEKVSVVNLLRYTNVFVNVGLAALVASILLFLLSPMIHRMMHEG